MKTLEELQTKANGILARNDHWKICQDGSYEMALSNSGYYEIANQINKLKGLKDEK